MTARTREELRGALDRFVQCALTTVPREHVRVSIPYRPDDDDAVLYDAIDELIDLRSRAEAAERERDAAREVLRGADLGLRRNVVPCPSCCRWVGTGGHTPTCALHRVLTAETEEKET